MKRTNPNSWAHSSLSWSMGTRVELNGFAASVAPTARHPLYLLCGLAVLVLNYVADVDEALVAAVGPHALETRVVGLYGVAGEHFRGGGAYTLGVHSVPPLVTVGRVPGCVRTAGAIFTFSVYYKYLQMSTNMIRYFL
jgi:hypothetical protein